jgi:sigma-B regulation protein RsbQ
MHPVSLRRNNVRVNDSKSSPIVFAHGYGCDQNMWRYVAPAFEADHKVVLFDHVGAGESDISAFDRQKYRTLGGYAHDVLEICHDLSLSGVTFIGHSVSSMIGILAAIEDPQLFKNLVLIGPSPSIHQ